MSQTVICDRLKMSAWFFVSSYVVAFLGASFMLKNSLFESQIAQYVVFIVAAVAIAPCWTLDTLCYGKEDEAHDLIYKRVAYYVTFAVNTFTIIFAFYAIIDIARTNNSQSLLHYLQPILGTSILAAVALTLLHYTQILWHLKRKYGQKAQKEG